MSFSCKLGYRQGHLVQREEMSRSCNSSLHVRDIHHAVWIKTHADKFSDNTNIAYMSVVMSLLNHAFKEYQFHVCYHKLYMVFNSTFHCIPIKCIVLHRFFFFVQVTNINYSARYSNKFMQMQLCMSSRTCSRYLLVSPAKSLSLCDFRLRAMLPQEYMS